MFLELIIMLPEVKLAVALEIMQWISGQGIPERLRETVSLNL
jgi:hypothetical protein